ncbi:MAG TPA: sugar phosphate isomerase/epimerase family protein [Anaerolineaceae bacterium]|jgi:protein FrlC
MKLSTATSVFVNYAIEDALEEIIRAGFDGVDIWCGRPHLYRQDYPPAALQALRRRLAHSHLAPVSFLPAFFRYPFSLSSPKEVIRQESISYMRDTIDNACALGAEYVLVVPSGNLHGQSIPESRAWFVDSLAQVCRYAETQEMKLGIEVVYPALSGYMNTTAQAREVIREIDSPSLGIVLDAGHINLSGEDMEGAIRSAGDLLFQVHVNDNDGVHQQNNIPGEGCFDFERLIRLLHANHFDGYLTLEIGWQYSFDPIPAVMRSLEQMRKVTAIS